MSGVLRLDQTARLFHGGAEMVEAWLGGVRVWKADPLAQYYGVGPGQIPMDLRFDAQSKMTISNGRVIDVTNDGGAGAYFQATSPEASAPTLDANAGGVVFSGDGMFTLLNPASLDGVHLLVAGKFSQATGKTLFGGQAPNDPFISAKYDGKISITAYRQSTNTNVNTGRRGGLDVANWNILEIRYKDGIIHFYLGGLRLTTKGFPIETGFPVKFIGGSVGYTGNISSGPFVGTLGRCISVVCFPGYTPAYLEPAVLAARNALAQQYGTTLA